MTTKKATVMSITISALHFAEGSVHVITMAGKDYIMETQGHEG